VARLEERQIEVAGVAHGRLRTVTGGHGSAEGG
jgi:hypothetical protein